MAGRKNFVSGSILTASDVNSFLMDQSVMVFDDSAARGSAIPTPSEGMVTYRKDLGGASGLEVFDGSAFGPVGTILQVAQTVKTNVFSTTSTSFVDVTGLSVSITPASTQSKVLVLADVVFNEKGDFEDDSAHVRIQRNSTVVYVGDAEGSRTPALGVNMTRAGSVTQRIASFRTGVFLDLPNTVSSITYKIQAMSLGSGNRTAFINRSGQDVNAARYGRFASSITVMEVAG